MLSNAGVSIYWTIQRAGDVICTSGPLIIVCIKGFNLGVNFSMACNFALDHADIRSSFKSKTCTKPNCDWESPAMIVPWIEWKKSHPSTHPFYI